MSVEDLPRCIEPEAIAGLRSWQARSGARLSGSDASARFLLRSHRPSSAVVLSLALSSCGGGANSSPPFIRSSLLRDTTTPSAVIAVAGESRPPDLDTLYWALKARPTEAELGRREYPPDQVFGQVEGAGIDRVGTVYILDSRAGEVRVFDSAGRFKERIGTAGRESGQFVGAQSLALDDRGRLYVGDLTRRIQVFQTGRRDATPTRVFYAPVAPLSMCAIGSRLYVHGASASKQPYLVHQFDDQGRLTRSFGRAFQLSGELVNQLLSRGRIACDPVHRIVAFAPTGFFGDIRGYNESGRLVWRTAMNGFRPMMLAADGTGFLLRVPPDGYDYVRSLIYMANAGFILQLGYATPDSRRLGEPYARLATFVLVGQSGRGSYLDDSLPELAVASAKYFVEISEVPYWHLRTHARLSALRRSRE